MKLFLLLFTPLLIFAKVHYAKVEPYESVVLKSAVSALVMEVDLEAEGSMVTSKRVIYLDGEKTEYKVNKVWRVADEKFISSYRAEIYIPSPKNSFSKLVKVEIK